MKSKRKMYRCEKAPLNCKASWCGRFTKHIYDENCCSLGVCTGKGCVRCKPISSPKFKKG